jgi:2-oxo-3-hexenedioate decarboxylase
VTPAEAAARLAEARHARATLDPFTDTVSGLDEAWAYAVQDEDRRTRLQQGERVVGAKLGLTSVAKQQRMGVDRPIVGFLTDSMLVEPEIAFVTSRPIDSALDLDDVAAHIATVGVAAEVIDSRWTDYRFRLPDVVADNTSAAGVVVGASVPLEDVVDLASLACTVSVTTRSSTGRQEPRSSATRCSPSSCSRTTSSAAGTSCPPGRWCSPAR